MRWLRMRGYRGIVGLVVLGLPGLLPLGAQLVLPREGESLPSFEVATIKPSPADAYMMRVQPMPDGYRLDNVPLGEIIRDAYGAVSSAQLVGGPQALLDKHFDVFAKMDAEEAAQYKALSHDDQERRMNLMMQALLRDRFQLKMHVETRELPVYALVLAKGGAKLQPTQPDPSPAPEETPALDAPPPEMPKHLPRKPPRGAWMMQMNAKGAEWSVSGGTMEQLAGVLTGQSDFGGRLVIDKTGLTGKYDWYLEWTPAGLGANSGDSDATAPGLVTALQEQMGLKVEAQKAPVQIVVIDRLEPPSPN